MAETKRVLHTAAEVPVEDDHISIGVREGRIVLMSAPSGTVVWELPEDVSMQIADLVRTHGSTLNG